jgi:hypothetical protein
MATIVSLTSFRGGATALETTVRDEPQSAAAAELAPAFAASVEAASGRSGADRAENGRR